MDFPRSDGERRSWFPDDGACLDYLDWLRWADAFTCPHCGGRGSWRLPDGRRSSASCARRVSPTAGTVLHRARVPLPTWFAAAWELTEGEPGGSVSGLQRRLGLRSYQTTWAMAQRYRAAMGNHLGGGLAGTVEIGVVRLPVGADPVAVAVAVERDRCALVRCRLRVAGPRPGASLRRFVDEVVHPAASVRGGGRGPVPAGTAEVAAAAEAWLRGPRRGAVSAGHLQGHLDELAFRFDGRGPLPPGALFSRLLRQAVVTGPVRAADLVHRRAPRAPHPVPPAAPVRPPPRTVTGSTTHPWRA